jgi:hypothetical protein
LNIVRRIDVVLKDPFQVCVRSQDRVFGRYVRQILPRLSVEKGLKQYHVDSMKSI